MLWHYETVCRNWFDQHFIFSHLPRESSSLSSHFCISLSGQGLSHELSIKEKNILFKTALPNNWISWLIWECHCFSLFACSTVRAHSGPVYKGVCKDFSRSQGHGFIRPSHGGEDIFVHISEWVAATLNTLSEDKTIHIVHIIYV